MGKNNGEKARPEVETLWHTAEKSPKVTCKLNKIEEHKVRDMLCVLPCQPQQNISSC